MMDFINQRIHRTDMDHSVDHIEKIGTTRGDGTLQTIYGMFPSDYQVDKLRNLCIKNGGIQTGPFGSQLHQEDYVDEGTPIITVEHLGENRITHNNLPKVSNADKCRLAKYSLEPGDIVFSRVGSVDRRALVRSSEDGWLFSGRCLRVRPDDKKLDSGYLSYFFGIESFKEYIRSIAVGATMPSLNTAILSDMEIPYPKNLTEQRRIAHILGTLDDKIENNRKTAKTLEDMAQAIFQSWFVDFDPVRAKMAGESPESICKRLKLTPEILDLFPDRLVDSELGEIPEGWEVKPLESVANFLNGLAMQKFPSYGLEDDLSVIKIAQLRIGNLIGADQASREIEPKYIVHDGDILFSWSGSLECVLWSGGTGALNQHLFKVTPKLNYPRWLCYFGIHHHLSYFREIAAGKATTMGHIQRHHLSDAVLTLPSIMNLEVISKPVQALFETVWKKHVESQKLSGIRDMLLPKLISGELRVPAAQDLVEDSLL